MKFSQQFQIDHEFELLYLLILKILSKALVCHSELMYIQLTDKFQNEIKDPFKLTKGNFVAMNINTIIIKYPRLGLGKTLDPI